MSNVVNLDQVRKNKGLLKKTAIDPFEKIKANIDAAGDGFDEDRDLDEEAANKASEEATFAALEKRNRENVERIRKERLAANQSVLRSHRIKQ